MKAIFLTALCTLFIFVSCGNSNNTKQETVTDNNTAEITPLQLSENEKANNYDVVYLVSDTGEYINSEIAQNENGNFGVIYYRDINQNLNTFNVTKAGELDEGNISAVSYDNKTLEGNFPSIAYPFVAKIDGKEMTFKAAKTPVTGAKIIEYTYSNVSPKSDDPRVFQFKTAIFALNNDSKSANIDKINLDINKDFCITDVSTFNDLTKLLTAQSLISNKMTPIYDEWVKSDYISHIENYSSQFGIDYLSEKVVSINKLVYEYTGGAHGNYATVNSVYSLENGNKLKIEDLIIDLKSADLIKLIVDKLVKIEGRDANSYFGLDEISLENNNFYLTSKGLVFTWGIYEIGPYAIGETRVLIPTEEIKPYLKDEYKTIFE
ncbi:RsiV family protein [Brachyspira pilosicoli]|uniref:Putative dynein heavy chain n=1 Tax=Brachyspira pilosicoli (strain ATCC BAA-1826 / 95/1000) TaxID=759914 RepID=D8IAX6_BRAP9|nr:RsiV family protein [Brachyspira pilosicoli]ADK30299.1 putative dynein heavy chain [Brachyspira pilosicoli 95/1000]